MIFPQLYIIYAALTIIVLGGVYIKGHVDGSSACDVRVAALLAESAIRERNAQQLALDAATELELARGKSTVKYKTLVKQVEKVVEKPVYRNVCLDTDGLHLANAALAGSSATPSEPAD